MPLLHGKSLGRGLELGLTLEHIYRHGESLNWNMERGRSRPDVAFG